MGECAIDQVAPDPLQTMDGHTGAIRGLAITPDGTRVASASDDQTLKVWDLATDAELLTLRGHGCEVGAVAISPDGLTAVSGGADGKLALWDVATGRLLRRQAGCRRPVRAIVVTPDGQWIVTGGGEPYSVRASWFYTHFNPTLRIWRLDSGKKAPADLGGRDLRMVTALAITSDGRTLLADVSYSLWDEVLGTRALMLNRSVVHIYAGARGAAAARRGRLCPRIADIRGD